MDEAKLRTIAQLQEFLNATQEISFTGAPGDSDQQRYEHIRRLTINLREDLHKKLRFAAVEQDCNATDIIVRLLEKELGK